MSSSSTHFKSETELFCGCSSWLVCQAWEMMVVESCLKPVHFSGTIELPGLGLINTISKAEFPPALQYNSTGLIHTLTEYCI